MSFKKILRESEKRNNVLKQIKEKYSSIKEVLKAIENKELDIESLSSPTGFKRLGFVKSEDGKYKVGEPDFYGNIIVYCDLPKTISVISLIIIHKSMEMKNDRYSVILDIKHFCKNSNTTKELIEKITNYSLPLFDGNK